jgi:hypothetical protein
MAHKKSHTGPVPPGNKPRHGPGAIVPEPEEPNAGEVSSAQEQDPKRRIGDFERTGEHSLQEPGGKKDANR